MFHTSKIKLAALSVISLSVASLLLHLYVANTSRGDGIYQRPTANDLLPIGEVRYYRKLWGSVSSLEVLQPYAKPRYAYTGPSEENNGFIVAKIYGGFEKIRPAICDLVAISRLLNATLVIPELQESIQSKGISSKFRSFSYIYDEEQFVEKLADEIKVVRSLPNDLKEARKTNKFPLFKPDHSAPPSFYINNVLPKLKETKVITLAVMHGGCLQPVLPPSLAEYQRLRCRVAFHALQFRREIQALGSLIVKRLRASRQPYIVFHPGLVKDNLAFNGCAELFQDVHSELIQYRRAQMIKHGTVREELNVDSMVRRRNGSCPIMPEEVGLLLRAVGYPPSTIIYLAGAEIFGGQRVLIPLRAMYTNLLDCTSLCTKTELNNLAGPESPLPHHLPNLPPAESEKELIDKWKKSGPRPRPLPPPPSRPFYQYEKEGWYGWVAESDNEPEPSLVDLRMQAHQLLRNALDYYVSVEADAFFPGYNNDGSRWPDFSSLVMGHRLYKTASRITYRPDRIVIAALFDDIHDSKYHPKRNWTVLVREHLNQSLGVEGLTREYRLTKPINFFAHPLPECSCRTSDVMNTPIPDVQNSDLPSFGSEDMCPEWMVRQIHQKVSIIKDYDTEESELPDDQPDAEGLLDFDNGSRAGSNISAEQDEEKDPDD